MLKNSLKLLEDGWELIDRSTIYAIKIELMIELIKKPTKIIESFNLLYG